ncbi:MAG TPA: hypothetical protein VGB79_07865 [Allosphingosinicella sp.]
MSALMLAAASTACAPVAGIEATPPPAAARDAAEPVPGFDPQQVRQEVEQHVAARLGPEAARLAAAASASLMATHHQGFPRPIPNAHGSVSFEGPGANAMVRGTGGWAGWSGTAQRPVASARTAEIDRILSEPAFWAEPDYAAPGCTDAGARRLVVRLAARTAVRQQSCGGTGLTGRLWELVFAGPG